MKLKATNLAPDCDAIVVRADDKHAVRVARDEDGAVHVVVENGEDSREYVLGEASPQISGRSFQKTVIRVTVLHVGDMPCDISLAEIARNTVEGDWSGQCFITHHAYLDGLEAAKALTNQGSDPGFFSLTEDGQDEEEE